VELNMEDIGAFTAIYERIEGRWLMATCPGLSGAITQDRNLD
jgi:hypothetical protein